MDQKKLKKITSELKEKYPDVGIQKIEIDERSGRSSFYLQPTEKVLATLPKEKAMQLRGPVTATTIRRDSIDRSFLDLSSTSSPSQLDATEIFKRAIKYYYE